MISFARIASTHIGLTGRFDSSNKKGAAGSCNSAKTVLREMRGITQTVAALRLNSPTDRAGIPMSKKTRRAVK